jgi:hypothetical protein
MQEIRFNTTLCRCAIRAAEAHEKAAFDACTNPILYHNRLMRCPPTFDRLPSDLLAMLCEYYQMPVPEQTDVPGSSTPGMASVATITDSHNQSQGTAAMPAAHSACQPGPATRTADLEDQPGYGSQHSPSMRAPDSSSREGGEATAARAQVRSATALKGKRTGADTSASVVDLHVESRAIHRPEPSPLRELTVRPAKRCCAAVSGGDRSRALEAQHLDEMAASHLANATGTVCQKHMEKEQQACSMHVPHLSNLTDNRMHVAENLARSETCGNLDGTNLSLGNASLFRLEPVHVEASEHACHDIAPCHHAAQVDTHPVALDGCTPRKSSCFQEQHNRVAEPGTSLAKCLAPLGHAARKVDELQVKVPHPPESVEVEQARYPANRGGGREGAASRLKLKCRPAMFDIGQAGTDMTPFVCATVTSCASGPLDIASNEICASRIAHSGSKHSRSECKGVGASFMQDTAGSAKCSKNVLVHFSEICRTCVQMQCLCNCVQESELRPEGDAAGALGASGCPRTCTAASSEGGKFAGSIQNGRLTCVEGLTDNSDCLPLQHMSSVSFRAGSAGMDCTDRATEDLSGSMNERLVSTSGGTRIFQAGRKQSVPMDKETSCTCSTSSGSDIGSSSSDDSVLGDEEAASSAEKQASETGSALAGQHRIGDSASAKAWKGGGQEDRVVQEEDPFDVFLQARKLRKHALKQTLLKLQQKQQGAGCREGQSPREVRHESFDMVQRQVHSFVGCVLEPRLSSGNISLQEYTDVLGRVVVKVLNAHKGANDASFLEVEAEKIERLADKYVAFIRQRSNPEGWK